MTEHTDRRPRIGVVVNPERAGLGDELRDRLSGFHVLVEQPDSADGIGSVVDGFVGSGVDIVAAVGGDGTQRTVAEHLRDTDVALAVVPGGTVNLLGQVLGIHTLDDTVRAIEGGGRRRLDVGVVDDHVFVLNASSGWDASVIERVDDRLKRFGRLGYGVAGVVEWFRSEPEPVTVDLDGERWYGGKALTVLVMNVGQRGSASLHLAPDALLDDGRLDVVVLRRHSVAGLARSVWATIRGREAPQSEVLTAQAARISVTWTEPVAVQRDGDELAPAAQLRYESLPSTLDVVSPADSSPVADS